MGPVNQPNFFREHNWFYTDPKFIMDNAQPGDAMYFNHHCGVVTNNNNNGTINFVASPDWNRTVTLYENWTYEMMNKEFGVKGLGALPAELNSPEVSTESLPFSLPNLNTMEPADKLSVDPLRP